MYFQLFEGMGIHTGEWLFLFSLNIPGPEWGGGGGAYFVWKEYLL